MGVVMFKKKKKKKKNIENHALQIAQILLVNHGGLGERIYLCSLCKPYSKDIKGLKKNKPTRTKRMGGNNDRQKMSTKTEQV